MNTIIFIGGIPGTGKTTLAYKLALKYKIDKVISLDTIKNTMKEFIIPTDKYVFTTTHEACKIENLSVVDGFIKHTRSINSYFKKVVNRFIKEKVIIVEGATITNEFINSFCESNIICINLYINNKGILIDRYKSKSKMRKGKWIDNIESIDLINEYLMSQSLINIESSEDSLESVERYIDESIFL